MVAVTDIEVYDEKRKIWKGAILKETEQANTLGKEVFFSRKYEPDKNEMDTIIQEYMFEEDDDLLGISFLLIPTEKILFIYEPSSILVKTPIRIQRKMTKRSNQ